MIDLNRPDANDWLAVNQFAVVENRILKKYGYPPDLADEAVQTVLAQAEILLREIGN